MAHVIDKLAWIQIVDKRVLAARSKGKDTFYLPGGKREAGETDQAGLAREIKEELDVDLVPATLRFLGQFEAQAHGQSEGVVVRLTCYGGDYAGSLGAAAEIEEIAWLTHGDRHKTSPAAQLVFDWLQGQGLID